MKRQRLRSLAPRIDRADRELSAPVAPTTSVARRFVPGSSAPDAPPTSIARRFLLGDPDAPRTSGSHKFLPLSACAGWPASGRSAGTSCATRSTPCAALAIEREKPEPEVVGLIVLGDDESTQPHKVRADARQARGHRAMSSAGAAMWWRCAAMVAGLIGLIDLVFRVLGSGGGAR